LSPRSRPGSPDTRPARPAVGQQQHKRVDVAKPTSPSQFTSPATGRRRTRPACARRPADAEVTHLHPVRCAAAAAKRSRPRPAAAAASWRTPARPANRSPRPRTAPPARCIRTASAASLRVSRRNPAQPDVVLHHRQVSRLHEPAAGSRRHVIEQPAENAPRHVKRVAHVSGVGNLDRAYERPAVLVPVHVPRRDSTRPSPSCQALHPAQHAPMSTSHSSMASRAAARSRASPTRPRPGCIHRAAATGTPAPRLRGLVARLVEAHRPAGHSAASDSDEYTSMRIHRDLHATSSLTTSRYTSSSRSCIRSGTNRAVWKSCRPQVSGRSRSTAAPRDRDHQRRCATVPGLSGGNCEIVSV